MNWRLDQLAEEPNATRVYRGNTLLKELPVKAQNDPSALDHFDDLFTYSEEGLQPERSYDYKLCSVYAFADVCGGPIIVSTKGGS